MINRLKNYLPAALIILCFATACKKESVQQNSVDTNTMSAAVTSSDSIAKAINPFEILGEYSVRGSRTIYNGQANEEGDNIRLILDYFGTKKILPSADKKHLTCPYGEGGLADKGWKYIIGYDFKHKKITLEPNSAMAAEIVPGSFETLYADYSAAYNSFTFQTRYTLKKDGNESEVIEPLAKN